MGFRGAGFFPVLDEFRMPPSATVPREPGGNLREIRERLAVENGGEHRADGQALMFSLDDGKGFGPPRADRVFVGQLTQRAEGLLAGGFRIAHTHETFQPGGIFLHGIGEAQVTVDFHECSLLSARRKAGGFAEIVMPEPDPQNECKQGDQGFGVFPPKNRTIGVFQGSRG